jgi:hypothetical protein
VLHQISDAKKSGEIPIMVQENKSISAVLSVYLNGIESRQLKIEHLLTDLPEVGLSKFVVHVFA